MATIHSLRTWRKAVAWSTTPTRTSSTLALLQRTRRQWVRSCSSGQMQKAKFWISSLQASARGQNLPIRTMARMQWWKTQGVRTPLMEQTSWVNTSSSDRQTALWHRRRKISIFLCVCKSSMEKSIRLLTTSDTVPISQMSSVRPWSENQSLSYNRERIQTKRDKMSLKHHSRYSIKAEWATDMGLMWQVDRITAKFCSVITTRILYNIKIPAIRDIRDKD